MTGPADGASPRDDLHELRSLVQRYARAVDDRDFDALSDLFDPDGVVDGLRGSSPVPEYLEAMRAPRPDGARSMHVLGDPLVELGSGGDVARLDTYGVVHQIGASDGGETHTMLGVRYLDEVVRRAAPDSVRGGWVIRHRSTTLLFSRSLA